MSLIAFLKANGLRIIWILGRMLNHGVGAAAEKAYFQGFVRWNCTRTCQLLSDVMGWAEKIEEM